MQRDVKYDKNTKNMNKIPQTKYISRLTEPHYAPGEVELVLVVVVAIVVVAAGVVVLVVVVPVVVVVAAEVVVAVDGALRISQTSKSA